MSTLAWPLSVIIILIVLNGLFVAAEFAIIGVRPSQMEQLAGQGHQKAAKILAVLHSSDKQNRYIATAQLGITIASLGLGMYGEPQIAHFLEPYLARLLNADPHDTLITGLGYVMAVSLLTYLHIVFGEMIPKSLALSAPGRAVFAVSQPMRVMQAVFSGPVRVLNGAGFALLRLFQIAPAEGESRLHTPQELELIVSESVEGGLLDENEQELVRNIFDFRERQVHQVMTPRPRIEAFSHDIPLPDLLEQAAQSQHSRFPVYQDNLDNIIGMIHIKDLVRYQTQTKGSFDIRLMLRSIPVVPEHYPVERLLLTFKHRRIHMAAVLDEFSGTAGLVTLEDLVEEVVGEVRDEFDFESEPLVQSAPGVLDVIGTYLLDDLQPYIDLEKMDELPDVETVNGLLMTELGRIPRAGDTLTYQQHIKFTVLAVEKLIATRVRIEYPVNTE